MPALNHIAPKVQQTDTFDAPYRAETSFKSFSTFLSRRLTVHSNAPNQYAKFSVLDILKHINLNQATLKGSTVKNWESDHAPADVDLQLPCSNSIDKKNIAQSLLEFLNTRSNQPVKNVKHIKEKTWFSRVKHDFGTSWVRLIFSVGYPRPNASTLDLNFTNNKGIAHDAIHASQAIQFDLASRKTFKIGAWHPKLVDWLEKNELLWFNPDIDEGLSRLSYRLSKSPNARLLQPELLDHFSEQTSHAALCDIYMRILQGEYAGCTLSEDDKAKLWESIVTAAESGSSESLQNNLLAWSKFNSVAKLRDALRDADTQSIVLDQLTQATKIGLDFKKDLKELITSREELSEPFKVLIDKALGATLIEGEHLFKMLYSWGSIQDVPEHELQTVFSDYLKSVTRSTDPVMAQRANNMLGWLHGDELASLNFFIDRIPEKLHIAPPAHLMKPVMHSVLNIIKTQGANALGPALARMDQLRISHADWRALATVLLKVPAKKAFATAELGKEQLSAEFMNILIQQSNTLDTLSPSVDVADHAPHQKFYEQIMDFLDKLNSQTTPPMLRNIIQYKSDDVEISLPTLAMTISTTQGSIVIKTKTGKYFVTAHGHGGPRINRQNDTNEFQFYWYDGSMFTAKKTASAQNTRLKGELSRFSKGPLPVGFMNLLSTARTLCANQFNGLLDSQEFWTASGVFAEKQIINASGLMDALLALKQGSIIDHALNYHLRINYEIEDGKPTLCTVNVTEKHQSTDISIPFRTLRGEPSQLTGLSNPWGVEPVMNKIESVQKTQCPPFGIVNLSTTLPWNEETQTFEGPGIVHGSGLVKFKWEGNITPQGLLSDGALYLEKQKNPAIVFNRTTSSSDIPVSLLPVMADLLGNRLSGSYQFSPKVWHDRNRWPIQGFEGFIDRYTDDHIQFSGYLTSTGRAVGILSEVYKADNQFASAWTGSFYVRPPSVTNYEPVKLDGHQKSLVGIPVSKSTVLTLHGFVREFLLKGDNRQPYNRVDSIYFCGESIHLKQITRSIEISYDSPNATRYFYGVGYAIDKKEKSLDIVFNPGDGGDDFITVRPKNYETLPNYQEIYRDSNGNSATLLIVNKEYRVINATFAQGLEYKGEVERRGNFIKPTKTGTLTFNGLSFTANFEKDDTVGQIEGKNSRTNEWLESKGLTGANRSITLKEWMHLISNGHLDWHRDLQNHLRVRELKSLMNEGTVFSR